MRAFLPVIACTLLLGCGPTTLHLRPVTGDVFSTGSAPRPRQPFGPFDGDPDARFAQLVSHWRTRLDARSSPGGAIAVVLDGQLRFSAGVGTREVGRDAPVEATTRFRTASITKMLVASAILSLVEDGTLALDRPLVDYVPSFRRGEGYDASAVTLEMLLTHTGGIPDSVYCPDGASLADTMEMHASDPYWAPPGRLFDYSNADYALLARVITEVTHRRWQDVVVERVLRPAGMSTASFVASESDPDLARGHVGGHVVWTHPVECEASRAAGGVIASVVDFARFAEAILAGGGDVLMPGSVDAMTTGHAVVQTAPLARYGYGLIETERAGLRTIEHSGFAYGFTSQVRLVPSRGFAVIVFVDGTASPDDVVEAATSAFLDVDEAAEPRSPAPPERFDDYVGTYDDENGALGRIEVVREGDGLAARFVDDHHAPIAPQFFRVTFERDAAGVVEYLVSRLGIARRVR